MGMGVDESRQDDAARERHSRRVAELAAACGRDLRNSPVVDQNVGQGKAVAVDGRVLIREAGGKDPRAGEREAFGPGERERRVHVSRPAAARSAHRSTLSIFTP